MKKLCMITGGSRGLGKSLYDVFENSGYDVFEFSRSGLNPGHMHCDFSDITDAAHILEEKFRQISGNGYSHMVMINNAGTLAPIGPISETDTAAWLENINVNLHSAILASGLFIKYFQDHSGRKILCSISSGAAIRAKYGWSLYCAAKAGLEQFCKSLAMEQRQQSAPINVVIIDPNVMDTDMQARIRSTPPDKFPELPRFLNLKAHEELLAPEDVAQSVYDILSGDIENGMKYEV